MRPPASLASSVIDPDLLLPGREREYAARTSGLGSYLAAAATVAINGPAAGLDALRVIKMSVGLTSAR
jgi:hypothetical protein